MISFLNSWASGVVASVIIGSIIEMILPEGNNKKYVKTVIGVFILFTIVSPVIAKVSGGIDIGNLINLEEYETYSTTASANIVSDTDVLNVYKTNISSEITNTLKQKGFTVTKIDIEINTTESNYGEISKIWLQIEEGVSNIEKVEINISNSTEKKINISAKVKEEIKVLLNNNYGVQKENILINE